MAPEVGYAKAHDVLAEGGVLAAFWNRVAWEKADIREALLEVYARAGSDLSVDGPMHPANVNADTEVAWDVGGAAAHGLHDPEVRLLSEERRQAFLTAVAG